MGSMGRGRVKFFQKHREPDEAPRYVLRYEVEREDDGRYLAEILELPGVMAYGESEKEAIKAAAALALRVFADRIEHDESPIDRDLSFVLHHV